MARKLFHKLCYIVLFFLCFAPIPLIGGHILAGQPLPAFVLMLLTVPLALLLTLVPGRIGGKIKHQAPAQPVHGALYACAVVRDASVAVAPGDDPFRARAAVGGHRRL